MLPPVMQLLATQSAVERLVAPTLEQDLVMETKVFCAFPALNFACDTLCQIKDELHFL